MGANVSIGGIVNRMRKYPSLLNKRNKGQEYEWYCLDIETAGIAPPPKGLPKSEPITYTCVMNEKQYKTLSQELQEFGFRRIKRRYMVIEGELTKKLPKGLLDRNQIGVIIYRVKSKEVENIKKQLETGSEVYVPIELITVNEVEYTQEELDATINFYQKKVRFKEPIQIKKVPETDGWKLVNGYISYLAAKEMRLEKVLAEEIEE